MIKTASQSIEHALALLRQGGLVAIPTETVYGLAADASNPEAVQKIYLAKGRPANNPLIIHLPHQDAMQDWAIEIPREAWQLAKHFWPGPLTLILPKHPSVSMNVTGGQETVALRVPNHPLTLELLHRFEGGLAAPSANRYGRISPTTAEHVKEELGDRLDFILDGGPCLIGIESTIVYLCDSQPIILRQGHISSEALSSVLEKPVLMQTPTTEQTILVPGSSASHYAPTKPLYLFEKEKLLETAQHFAKENRLMGVLCFGKMPQEFQAHFSKVIIASDEPLGYAQTLYTHLRTLDNTPADCLLVEAPPSSEPWLAIRDRLQRASLKVT